MSSAHVYLRLQPVSFQTLLLEVVTIFLFAYWDLHSQAGSLNTFSTASEYTSTWYLLSSILFYFYSLLVFTMVKISKVEQIFIVNFS